MVKPILARHGLCYTQSTKIEGEDMIVETRVYHTSGEYISDAIKLLIDKGRMNSMQSLGSAITYARRYGLQNLLGIVGDEDDDGASSGSKHPSKPPAACKVEMDRFVREFKGYTKGNPKLESEYREHLKPDKGNTNPGYWKELTERLHQYAFDE